MLAPADAAFVRRDPAVPGLALVLDDEALAERLRAVRPELDLIWARATYVRYKPGTSCLVGYRLRLGDGEVPAFAKAYRRGDAAKVAKARSKGAASVVALGELVVVGGVGGDRDLPAATGLEHPARHRRLLQRVLPGVPEYGDFGLRCLRYKPERRWVGVVEREGEPFALLKAYQRHGLARARAGLRFARDISPAAPRLLGVSRRVAALASSWLPGDTLSDLLVSPGGSVSSLAEAGAALAGLHAGPVAGLMAAAPDADAEAVFAAAGHLQAVDSRLGAAAAGLVDRLGPRLVASPSNRPTARHGDYSPDQVVLGPHGAAIIDFDNTEIGDPAADLGQFVAALSAGALVPGPAARWPAEPLAAEFLSGYEAAGGVAAADRVADHAAAALVRLAVEPFRTRAPDWPARTEALLDHASVLMVRTAR